MANGFSQSQVAGAEFASAAAAYGVPNAGEYTALAHLQAVTASILDSEFSAVYNVKSPRFGAVGNGVEDDTEAVQGAIDAAEAAGGGIVLIPQGTFRAELLSVASNVQVVGLGRGSIVEQITYTTTRANPAFIIEKVTGAAVRNLVVRGRSGTQHDLTAAPAIDGMQAVEYAGLILVRGAIGTRIEDVRCEDFPNGIVVWKAADDTVSSGTLIRALSVETIGLAGVLSAYNEYLTVVDVYGKDIQNTQSRAQHVIYINTDTDHFHVANVHGEDITDQVLDLSGLPSVVQVKGRYGTVRGVSGQNVPCLVTMANAVQCAASHITGTCAIVGAPGLDEAAVYISGGDRNIVSQVSVACTDKPAVHVQSEDGTVVRDVVGSITTSAATVRGIYILGGQYVRVESPTLAFTGSGGVGVEFSGGLVNAVSNPAVTGATTGISVLSGVNQATVSYVPRLVSATTKYSDAGTSTVRVVPPLTGTATWDPPSIASGARTTSSLTVTGALVGQPVVAGFSQNLSGLVLTGYVESANTVTVVLQNPTGGPVDLGSGTLTASVLQV